jgi:L-histidine N-alpha-methyltransferase
MIENHVSRLTSRKVAPIRPVPGILEDAAAGLLRSPRSVPPKYFYDDLGSRLFDAICETREYYPTRTEESLLARHARDIIALARPAHILEFGSGTARKTRQLFNACNHCRESTAYWPFDVCESMLLESGYQLVEDYDWLTVNALVGDYLGGLHHLPRLDGRCLYLFLGGTIGNFPEQEAAEFLDEVRDLMTPDDFLLLGADRVKEPAILHAAYNDGAGITAKFNLNLLRVLNRELDADFRLDGFQHEALFNPLDEQIEMYLVSKREQTVTLRALDETLELADGERILTEISRKFTPPGLEAMLGRAGFDIQCHFEPENGFYSLLLARPS